MKNVLIETYWNVKVENYPLDIVASWVLIETYWNVKVNLKPVIDFHRRY